MQSFPPFIWQPKDVVAALETLPLSSDVPRKTEVTQAVRGDRSSQHPLMVAELTGGKIIGDLRLVATAQDVVVGGLQTVFGCDRPAGHYALARRRFRLPRKRRGTAWLLGAANSDNYYHWLLDSLPRWKILQAAGGHDYDFVLLHSQPRPFQEETLDWLGVPANKRLRCSKNFVHQFERLVVPSMPFPAWEVPAWVCTWLRSLAPAQGAGPEKVFLSRRGVGGRQLVNEPALQSALEAQGYVTLQPGKWTVSEQARWLGSARQVVAPHGAALANLVFAPPGAWLLEIFHPRHKNVCYANLAAACGLRYASLDGHDLRAGDRRLEYAVDIPAVLRMLAETP